MKRVAVIGCPGAGKSYFSRQLGSQTGLPVIYLDYYYHQLKYNYYEDKKAWVAHVKKLLQQEYWIMDGNYSSTFPERFKRADTVIFFDYPRRFSVYRVLKRRFQYRNKHREEMPSGWQEKADFEFLKYVWYFNKDSKNKILDAIHHSDIKNVIVFKNPRQAKAYLSEVQSARVSD
jgi:adenylate kinase family enzyme